MEQHLNIMNSLMHTPCIVQNVKSPVYRINIFDIYKGTNTEI
jgi:hypothetical protein